MKQNQDTVASQVPAVVLTAKRSVQALMLSGLQAAGILTAAINAPEVREVVGLLPPATSAKLFAVGLALAGVSKALAVLGDLVDNGKIDKSWPLQVVTLFLLLGVGSLTMSACTGLSVYPSADGCLMTQVVRNGKAYAFGTCLDQRGNIAAYKYQWENADGVALRARYTVATKVTRIEYKDAVSGQWLPWGDKAGISLDGAPPEAQIGGKG